MTVESWQLGIIVSVKLSLRKSEFELWYQTGIFDVKVLLLDLAAMGESK